MGSGTQHQAARQVAAVGVQQWLGSPCGEAVGCCMLWVGVGSLQTARLMAKLSGPYRSLHTPQLAFDPMRWGGYMRLFPKWRSRTPLLG